MNIRHHSLAPATQHARELREWFVQVGDVRQGEATHHQVDGVARQSQRMQIPQQEFRVRYFLPRDVEHFGRLVAALHDVAALRQIRRLATGAARGVQRLAGPVMGQHRSKH
jgi:hypothetical protein